MFLSLISRQPSTELTELEGLKWGLYTVLKCLWLALTNSTLSELSRSLGSGTPSPANHPSVHHLYCCLSAASASNHCLAFGEAASTTSDALDVTIGATLHHHVLPYLLWVFPKAAKRQHERPKEPEPICCHIMDAIRLFNRLQDRRRRPSRAPPAPAREGQVKGRRINTAYLAGA